MEASEQYRLLMADVYELAGLSRRTSEAIARELGQTAARWHVLSVLSAGPCTVPAAARRLGLTRQGVQRVAGDLLAARLLQASPNPDHARSPLLTLTNRGQLVLGQLTQRSDAARGRLLHQARITAEDLAAARTTLQPLLQSLTTPDRNVRPGIPATAAELPVNDRVPHQATFARSTMRRSRSSKTQKITSGSPARGVDNMPSQGARGPGRTRPARPGRG